MVPSNVGQHWPSHEAWDVLAYEGLDRGNASRKPEVVPLVDSPSSRTNFEQLLKGTPKACDLFG